MDTKRKGEIALLIYTDQLLKQGVGPQTIVTIIQAARDTGANEREAKIFAHEVLKEILKDFLDTIDRHPNVSGYDT